MSLGPLSVGAGPWMQIDERGLVSVVIRLLPPVDGQSLAQVQPWIGKAKLPVPVVTRVVPVSGGMLAGHVVASWTLPPLTSGTVRLGADLHAPSVIVPAPPAPGDAVCIAVTGSSAWPSADALEAAGKRVQTPISAVLVLGTAAAGRVGSGGWESRIPLLVRLDPSPVVVETEPLTQAILGQTSGVADLTWGCLGLPSLLAGPEVAVALARRPRAWNVLLDPAARWDLALRALPERGDPGVLRTPIGIARMLDVPFICAGGSPAGFVSEPLGTDAGGALQVATNGVRYLAATPAGDGVRSLDRFTALGMLGQEPTLICADAETLTVVIDGGWQLHWRHEATVDESGPGRGDVVKLATAWRTAHAEAEAKPPTDIPPAGPDPLLLWVPRKSLAIAEWNLLELYALAASTAESDHLLARRLVADPWFVGDEEILLRRLPDWLRRDALLRWMAEPDALGHAWVRVAGTTEDPLLVRALLANVEHGGAQILLEVLVERLTAQAAGTIPVDEDPMLQSRLTAAVFDASTLSPTPLRAIARDLEPRLSPLGRQPVTRFLERVGRFRQ